MVSSPLFGYVVSIMGYFGVYSGPLFLANVKTASLKLRTGLQVFPTGSRATCWHKGAIASNFMLRDLNVHRRFPAASGGFVRRFGLWTSSWYNIKKPTKSILLFLWHCFSSSSWRC